MAQIVQPAKRQTPLGTIGTIAGGVIGAIGAGPGGAMAGAQAGAALGGTVGGVTESLNNKAQQAGIQAPQQSNAMARRQEQMQQDNLETLKQSEQALTYMPEDIRQQYAPAIVQARMLEEQKRGIV